MLKQFVIICTLGMVSFCSGQDRIELSGQVFDQSTKDGVPFATIHIDGTSIGTCTNLDGAFKLKISKEYLKARLLISSMGYELGELPIEESLSGNIRLPLTPSVIELGTVTIRPMLPEEHLKEAIRKLQINYGTQFSANAYFRQYGSDNGTAIQFSEGYMLAHIFDFLNDTVTIDQRLLLYQLEDNQDKLNFRRQKRDKKFAKAIRKAEKMGETINEDSVKQKAGKISLGLITPDLMMEQDPVRQIESFLDSTQFKKYEYQYEDDLSYQGRLVNVISFRSKRKVKLENVGLKGPLNGTIYLDKESDAIVGVDYRTEMVIPTLAKPLLFFAGFGASNPWISNRVRYLMVGDRWFPRSVQINMNLDLTQRYWFSSNETSRIEMELLMSISNVDEKAQQIIPEEFKFDRKKKFEEQIYPVTELTWDEVNRITLEEIK